MTDTCKSISAIFDQIISIAKGSATPNGRAPSASLCATWVTFSIGVAPVGGGGGGGAVVVGGGAVVVGGGGAVVVGGGAVVVGGGGAVVAGGGGAVGGGGAMFASC